MPDLSKLLEPQEAWTAAEQDIDFYVEEKHYKEWLKWRKTSF